MAIKRIEKNKWQIRVYHSQRGGKRREISKTFIGTRRAAEAEERRLKRKKDKGELVISAKMTVNQLLDFYLHERRHNVEPGTLLKNQKLMRSWIRPYIGDVQIGKLKQEQVKAIYDKMLDDKKSPNYVILVHGFFNQVIRYAVKNQLLSANPLNGIEVPKSVKPKIDFFTQEEAKAFVAVKDLFWYGVAFVLALYTGMRPEEFMGLRWDDISWTERTVSILRHDSVVKWLDGRTYGKPKTSNSYRTIDVGPMVMKMLKRHYEAQKRYIADRIAKGLLYHDTTLVFATRDGRTPVYHNLQIAFKRQCRSAGVPVKNIYALRHTHATVLLKMGWHVKEVAERLGHTAEECLKTYAHVLLGRLREAAEAIEVEIPLTTGLPKDRNPHPDLPDAEYVEDANFISSSIKDMENFSFSGREYLDDEDWMRHLLERQAAEEELQLV